MPTVPARIDLEVRIQTHGHPPLGYIKRTPAVLDAFPGFDMEDVVKTLIRDVDGKPMQVLALPENPTAEEIAAFKEDAEGQVRELFEDAVGNKGPKAGERWALLGDAVFTGSEKPRWVPGLEAIAFELGTESLDAMNQPTRKFNARRQVWKDDNCYAETWICFRIVK